MILLNHSLSCGEKRLGGEKGKEEEREAICVLSLGGFILLFLVSCAYCFWTDGFRFTIPIGV